jgi:hypothetical protein
VTQFTFLWPVFAVDGTPDAFVRTVFAHLTCFRQLRNVDAVRWNGHSAWHGASVLCHLSATDIAGEAQCRDEDAFIPLSSLDSPHCEALAVAHSIDMVGDWRGTFASDDKVAMHAMYGKGG